MKKGISLIVLVITIIVMIIIAGAIIISLSQTNVIDQADNAKYKSDVAEAKSLVALIFASNLYYETGAEGAKVYQKATAAELQEDINTALSTNGFVGYSVTIDADDYEVHYTIPPKGALTSGTTAQ